MDTRKAVSLWAFLLHAGPGPAGARRRLCESVLGFHSRSRGLQVRSSPVPASAPPPGTARNAPSSCSAQGHRPGLRTCPPRSTGRHRSPPQLSWSGSLQALNPGPRPAQGASGKGLLAAFRGGGARAPPSPSNGPLAFCSPKLPGSCFCFCDLSPESAGSPAHSHFLCNRLNEVSLLTWERIKQKGLLISAGPAAVTPGRGPGLGDGGRLRLPRSLLPPCGEVPSGRPLGTQSGPEGQEEGRDTGLCDAALLIPTAISPPAQAPGEAAPPCRVPSAPCWDFLGLSVPSEHGGSCCPRRPPGPIPGLQLPRLAQGHGAMTRHLQRLCRGLPSTQEGTRLRSQASWPSHAASRGPSQGGSGEWRQSPRV